MNKGKELVTTKDNAKNLEDISKEKKKPEYALDRLLALQTLRTLPKKDWDEGLGYAIRFIKGLNPQDDIEKLLIHQMFNVHNLIMTTSAIAQNNEGVDAYNVITKRLCRLLELFNNQVETLQRYRGKNSQQKVTVEHIHVNKGGQAIVGNVSKTGGD